jgi:hypothetical protein
MVLTLGAGNISQLGPVVLQGLSAKKASATADDEQRLYRD